MICFTRLAETIRDIRARVLPQDKIKNALVEMAKNASGLFTAIDGVLGHIQLAHNIRGLVNQIENIESGLGTAKEYAGAILDNVDTIATFMKRSQLESRRIRREALLSFDKAQQTLAQYIDNAHKVAFDLKKVCDAALKADDLGDIKLDLIETAAARLEKFVDTVVPRIEKMMAQFKGWEHPKKNEAPSEHNAPTVVD